jgi:hypothetical protein
VDDWSISFSFAGAPRRTHSLLIPEFSVDERWREKESERNSGEKE